MVDGSYSSGKVKLKSSRRERREKESFATALDELISLEKTATAVNYSSHDNNNNNVSRATDNRNKQLVAEEQQQQQPVEQPPPPSPTIRPKKHPRIDLATTVGNITNSPHNPSSTSSASPPSPVCTKTLWLDDVNNNKKDNKLVSNYQEQIEKLKQVTVTVKQLPVSPPQAKINNNLIITSKSKQQKEGENETTTSTVTTTTKVVYDMSKTPQFVRNMDLLQRMRIQYNKKNNIISHSNKRKHCDFEIETGEKPLTPPMLYSKIWKPNVRDEWFDCTSEMAALCAEASLRSTLSQQNKQSKISMASMNNTINNIGTSSENNSSSDNNINTNDNNDINNMNTTNKVAEPINLSKEYIHQRIDIDDPLYGYQIRHSKGGWLQGFILYTTFTTWVKYFKWDSLHPKSGIDSRKVSEYGIKDYKWDSEGKLSTELESQLRNGDPDDSGMIWNTIAEISLVSGLGCGEYLLRMAIDDIIQKGYSYIVLHATSSSKAFYERFGFIRVGAVCKYGRSKNICGYRHWTYANENKRNLTAIGGPSYMMALKLPSNNNDTVSTTDCSSFLDTVEKSSCFVNVKPTVLPNHLNVLSKEQQLLQKQHQERRRRQLQKQQQKQPNQYTIRTSTSTSTITTPSTTTTNSMPASANANNSNSSNNTNTTEKTAEEEKNSTPAITITMTTKTPSTIIAVTTQPQQHQQQQQQQQQHGQTTKEASKDDNNTKTTTTTGGTTTTPIAATSSTATIQNQQKQQQQQKTAGANNNNNTKSTSPTTTTTTSTTTNTGTRHSKRAPKSTTFYTATMASTTSDENSFTNNSMIKRRGMGLFGKKVCKRHPQKWYACTVVRENFMKKTFEVLWDDGTVSFNLPMTNFKPSDPIEQSASSKSPKTTTPTPQQFHNKENNKNTAATTAAAAATTTTQKKNDKNINTQKRISSSSNNNKPKVTVAMKKSNTSSKHKKPITTKKNNNNKSNNKSKPTPPAPNGYYGSIWRNKQFFEVRIQPGAKFVARFISKNIAEQTKSFVVDCLNNKKITFDTSKQIAIDTFKAKDNALLGL